MYDLDKFIQKSVWKNKDRKIAQPEIRCLKDEVIKKKKGGVVLASRKTKRSRNEIGSPETNRSKCGKLFYGRDVWAAL